MAWRGRRRRVLSAATLLPKQFGRTTVIQALFETLSRIGDSVRTLTVDLDSLNEAELSPVLTAIGELCAGNLQALLFESSAKFHSIPLDFSFRTFPSLKSIAAIGN